MKVINYKFETDQKEVYIKFLSDAHCGSNEHNMTALQRDIDLIKDTPNMLCGINGDMLDNILPNGKFNAYDETNSPQVQLALVMGMLKPIKDKIIFITQGNHEGRSWKSSGLDPCQMLADFLEVQDRYSPLSCIVILDICFKHSKNKTTNHTFSIFASHGNNGGGRRVGSKANAIEDMANICPNADLFVHSHTHQALTFKDDYYEIDKLHKKVIQRTRTYLNTGAYLNYGGYGEDKLYRVPTTSSPTAKLSVIRKFWGGRKNTQEEWVKDIKVEL